MNKAKWKRVGERRLLMKETPHSLSSGGNADDTNRVPCPPSQGTRETPPLHPIEVRITIGAEDWDYVRRMLWDWYRGMDNGQECLPIRSGFGGGAGGSYSVTIARRDVSPEKFRSELDVWFTNQKQPPKG